MIFLDNASTTRMYDEAFDVMKKYALDEYYNPSALYEAGINVHKDVESARGKIAKLIGSEKDNIIFTSSASEATNLAIMGSLKANFKHIVTSQIEHPATYNAFKNLSSKGIKVDYLLPRKDGVIDISEIKRLVTKQTNLLSVMYVNNETGAINDIKKIVIIAKQINPNIIVICDAVQAFGKIKINVKSLDVDFLIASAHKIHGPKGVGLLYSKNKQNIKPQILGGGQESGYRSGTENVPGIMAFSKACEIKFANLKNDYEHVSSLKEYCIKQLENDKDIIINSDEKTSPYILSFSVKDSKAEVLLHLLEKYDICVGNGSACSSHHTDNRVLKAMNVSSDYVTGTIRLSFSESNSIEEVKKACELIMENINKLRNVMNNK